VYEKLKKIRLDQENHFVCRLSPLK